MYRRNYLQQLSSPQRSTSGRHRGGSDFSYPSDEPHETPRSTKDSSGPGLNSTVETTSSPPGLLATSFSSGGTHDSPERNANVESTPSPPSPSKRRSQSRSKSSRSRTGRTSGSRPKSRPKSSSRGRGSYSTSPMQSPTREDDRGIRRGANIIRRQLMGLPAESNEGEKAEETVERPTVSGRDNGIMRGAEILRQQLLEQSSLPTSRSASVQQRQLQNHQQWPDNSLTSQISSPKLQASPRRKHQSRSSSSPRHRRSTSSHHERRSSRDAFNPTTPTKTGTGAAPTTPSRIKKPSPTSKKDMDILLDVQDLEEQMRSLRAHLHGHGNDEYSYLFGEGDKAKSPSPTNRNSQNQQRKHGDGHAADQQPREIKETDSKTDSKLDMVVKTEGLVKVRNESPPVEPVAALALAEKEPSAVREDPPAQGDYNNPHPFPAVESKSLSQEHCEETDQQEEEEEDEEQNENQGPGSSYLPGGLSVKGHSFYSAPDDKKPPPQAPLPRTPRANLDIQQQNSSDSGMGTQKDLAQKASNVAFAIAVSRGDNKSKLDKDPGYQHALNAGTLWQTLVGEQIRFPKHWFDGARTPYLLGDSMHNKGTWSYVANVPVRSDRFLNRMCVKNRTKPGKILLHIVVRDEINWTPSRHVVIGVYHPNARGIRQSDRPNASDESLRIVWMAVRRCTGLVDDDDASYLADTTEIQSNIDTVLLQGGSFEEKGRPSPLGGKHMVNNDNVRAVFGDDAPMETIFVLERELYQILTDAADAQGRHNMKSKFSATLTLLEQFVYKRRR